MVLKVLGALGGVCVVIIGGCAAYVNATYEIDYSSTPEPKIVASSDTEVIARGEYVVNALAHCSICHQLDDDGHSGRHLNADLKNLSGGHVFAAGPFGTFRAANITPESETGIGGLSDGQLARVIRHGVDRKGRIAPMMKLAVGAMADEDLVAVVSYLRSLAPQKHAVAADEWGILARALSSQFLPNPAPEKLTYVAQGGVSAERGAYLSNGPAFCYGCHTPADPMHGFVESGPRFSGAPADEDEADPGFEYAPPNLTPDPTTGHITTWTEEQFVARFKAGRAFPGSRMPWENFQKMTEDDMRSIYRYLQSLAPVRNAVGPTRREKGWKPPETQG